MLHSWQFYIIIKKENYIFIKVNNSLCKRLFSFVWKEPRLYVISLFLLNKHFSTHWKELDWSLLEIDDWCEASRLCSWVTDRRTHSRTSGLSASEFLVNHEKYIYLHVQIVKYCVNSSGNTFQVIQYYTTLCACVCITEDTSILFRDSEAFTCSINDGQWIHEIVKVHRPLANFDASRMYWWSHRDLNTYIHEVMYTLS